MNMLLRKFRVRCSRMGWSPWLPGFAALAGLAAAALISGMEGVVFTLALGLAFLLGTAAAAGPFHLRALAATPLDRPVSRERLLSHMARHPGSDTARPLCILVALDDFARLEETHGRQIARRLGGDFALRLMDATRSADTVADLGGGRFALFMPPDRRIDLETAVQAALRLHRLCATPLAAGGVRCHVTCCIGFVPPHRLPPETPPLDILRAAEAALATAQREGPRTVRAYDHTMAAPAPSQPDRTPPVDMARALEKGEVVAWFQPQICADTGRLTGIEALARWCPTQSVAHPPAAFMPAIRAQGLTAALTDRMLESILSQMAQWDRSGVRIPLASLNLGPDDLDDPTLPARVERALTRHRLSPLRLAVEVPETLLAAAGPDGAPLRILRALAAMGCPIDLDGFGTGGAQADSIRRVAVHRLKLDRSLVAAVDGDPDRHARTAAILKMAARLGVRVLAEGVERPGEHVALAQLGCDEVQGFAIARPMPGPELLSWHLRREKTQPYAADPSPAQG